jgi:hypothetical protein
LAPKSRLFHISIIMFGWAGATGAAWYMTGAPGGAYCGGAAGGAY